MNCPFCQRGDYCPDNPPVTSSSVDKRTDDEQLRYAMERVYQTYGNDLPAFMRDVERDRAKKRATPRA